MDFLAILGFWLIGIPGLIYVFLVIRGAERRRTLAYEWNTGELKRRQSRLEAMQAETKALHKRIADLMLEIARLEAQVGKLNDIINARSIKATAPKSAA